MAGDILQGSTSDEMLADISPAFDKKAGRRKRQPAGPAKISAIKQQVKRAGRYSVFIDDKYAFSLSEGALLDAKIYIGQEVTAEQLADYKDTSAFDKAYGNTLAFVARRLRSEWELRQYFKRKAVDEDAGEQILERLRGFGYVSDLNFARSWVDNRRAIKSVSRRRLMLELRQKHVPDDVVQIVLAEDETTDKDTLRVLVAKKRQQSRYQDDTRLMQYLARQGYGYDDIKRALQGTDDEY
ncbi:MAG TPA: RecX family transcriptional regulator [Hymenobacter sp.]|jgi:regulatory protein